MFSFFCRNVSHFNLFMPDPCAYLLTLSLWIQRQPPECSKKIVLKNLTKCTRKYPASESLFYTGVFVCISVNFVTEHLPTTASLDKVDKYTV